MKSYDDLFQKEFKISKQIDEKFIKIYNEQGLNKGIEYLKSINCEWLDYDGYYIQCVISEFTKNSLSDNDKKQLVKSVSKQKDVEYANIEINKNFNIPELIVKKADCLISVMPFSKLVPQANEMLSNLENNNRFCTCFETSKCISLNLGIKNNDIVTGYSYGYTDKSKFLHSWVETKLKGQDVVIDGTFNAIFNKEGYYKLRHIKQLSRISSTDFKNDINNYLCKIKRGIPLEVYLVFRDEIIKDFKRNLEEFER